MKISSTAWHLRLMRSLEDDYKPKNLCQHFWTVAAAMIFVAIIGPFIGMFKVGIFIATKLPTFERKKRKTSRGLIGSYIKARKEHYCPLIEVIEEPIPRE